MKHRFNWPTRPWDRDEVMQLLLLFCPQTFGYKEIMFHKLKLVYQNDMMQEGVYQSIVKRRDIAESQNLQYINLPYYILRGSIASSKKSDTCTGLGQLILSGRQRVKVIDESGDEVIQLRPYGDVRIVEEIINLAVHLSLLTFDERTSELSLTDLGKSAVFAKQQCEAFGNTFIENDFQLMNLPFRLQLKEQTIYSDCWWDEILLMNPIIHRIVSIAKKAMDGYQNRFVSIYEIAEEIGFYGESTYMSEPYAGKMYTYENESYLKFIRHTPLSAYVNTVCNTLIKQGIFSQVSMEDQLSDETKTSGSFRKKQDVFIITKDGENFLQSTENNLVISMRHLDNLTPDGILERRVLLLALLSNQGIQQRGITIEEIANFYQPAIQISSETILDDILGLYRIGIPIRITDSVNKEPIISILSPDYRKELQSCWFSVPANVIDSDLVLANLENVEEDDEKKRDLRTMGIRDHKYLTLVDYRKDGSDPHYVAANGSISSQYRFQQLLADMIYENIGISAYFLPYYVARDEAPSFLIQPMVFCYHVRQKVLWIIDASPLFSVSKEKRAPLPIRERRNLDANKLSTNQLVSLFLLDPIDVPEKKSAQLQNGILIKGDYHYLQQYLQNAFHLLRDEMFLMIDKLRYTVLVDNQIPIVEETYQYAFQQVEELQGVKPQYIEWLSFLKWCNDGNDHSIFLNDYQEC